MYSCARGWKTDCGGTPRELNVAHVVLGLAPLVCLIRVYEDIFKKYTLSLLRPGVCGERVEADCVDLLLRPTRLGRRL